MTVNVMRYISDLRIGRVNPSHFNFEIHVQDKKYDLAEFVSDNAVDATDVPELIAKRRAGLGAVPEDGSRRWRIISSWRNSRQRREAAEPLPMVTKAVSRGRELSGGRRSGTRLQLEGDAAPTLRPCRRRTVFNSSSCPMAVKSYQQRHGIDGGWQADAADDQEPECADDGARGAVAGLAGALALAAGSVSASRG